MSDVEDLVKKITGLVHDRTACALVNRLWRRCVHEQVFSIEDACLRGCFASISYYKRLKVSMSSLISGHVQGMMKAKKEGLLRFLVKNHMLSASTLCEGREYLVHGSRDFVRFVCDGMRRGVFSSTPTYVDVLFSALNLDETIPDVLMGYMGEGPACSKERESLRATVPVIRAFVAEDEEGFSRVRECMTWERNRMYEVLKRIRWSSKKMGPLVTALFGKYMDHMWNGALVLPFLGGTELDALYGYQLSQYDATGVDRVAADPAERSLLGVEYNSWRHLFAMAVKERRYDIAEESLRRMKRLEPWRRSPGYGEVEYIYGADNAIWDLCLPYMSRGELREDMRCVVLGATRTSDEMLLSSMLSRLPEKMREDQDVALVVSLFVKRGERGIK